MPLDPFSTLDPLDAYGRFFGPQHDGLRVEAHESASLDVLPKPVAHNPADPGCGYPG